MAVDPKKVDPARLERAMALLEREEVRQDKIAKGLIKGTYSKPYSEMSPEEKKKAQAATRRRTARQSLMVQKAKAQGITVTDKEIDEFLKKK